MPITAAYNIYGVSLGSTLVGGITQQSMNQNWENFNDDTSGEPYARYRGIKTGNPEMGFTTVDPKAVIDAFDSGAAWTDISGLTGGVKQYLYKEPEGGLRDGTDGESRQAVAGFVVPRRLNIPGDGSPVTLDVAVIVTYDGTNDPIQLATGVTLPSGLTDALRWAMGGVTVGGVSLTGLTSINIDFGINVNVPMTDGEIWPCYAGIKAYKPSITINGIDPSILADSGGFPIEGGAATHANTIIYLRKRDADGFVANITAEHIKITAGGYAIYESEDGSQGDNVSYSMRLDCYYDGTNLPITFDTASAIS